MPFSVFWLIEGDAFIGEANVRHELIKEGGHVGYGIRPSRQRQGYGKLILALALEECRRLGLARVLVTCLEDNLASARIIEANGGELENVIDDPAGRGPLRRYWIALYPVRASARRAVADPVTRAGAAPAGAVAWIGEPAAVERQAPATDAFGQPAPEPLQLGDALIDPRGPRCAQGATSHGGSAPAPGAASPAPRRSRPGSARSAGRRR